jgi:hypothetical protein
MLGDKKPEISPLAKMVPEDFWFAEFHSVTKMVDLLDNGDLFALHIGQQGSREARTQNIGERTRTQIAIDTNKLLRPFYDAIVEEVAVTGSDLYLAEGSDLTMIFRVKQPDVFKQRMDGFLSAAEKANKGAVRKESSFLEVPYVHVSTPDRTVNVFSAYPEPNLHIRSNSKDGFFTVLKAYKGKDVHSLGDATELAYIRTIMKRNAAEEDGFVYLSDPFIRRLVGPQVKLTERRRVLCYNHLRMINHAALLYQTEHGKPAASIEELVKAECLPDKFKGEPFTCLDGGTYTLSADGCHGVCSHHGHANNLVPCIETPLAWVNGVEADEYKGFLDEYNRYWRTYFDPIAIRIQVTPERYRLETVILPLIDNSIYTGLASALNGKPEPLDALPVPKRNIFSVVGRVNKEKLITKELIAEAEQASGDIARAIGLSQEEASQLDVIRFIEKGLGNQVGLHIYDNAPMFDINFAELFGELFGTFNGVRGNVRTEEVAVAFVVASLTAPVYVAVPVQDEKIVDDFLEKLDRVAAAAARKSERLGWWRFGQDFYKAKLSDGTPMRGYSVSIGPVKWRFFWSRIDKGLYVASKTEILEDLVAESKKEKAVEVGPTAHAMVRLRPANWNQVLGDYRLSWAENNRIACLNNQGPISSAGRAVLSGKGDGKDATPEQLGKEANRVADRFGAVHFYCPEGGRYQLSPKDGRCSCSVHGSPLDPIQPLAPNDAHGPGEAMKNLKGLTATLTFLEDGLHAVVIVDRK